MKFASVKSGMGWIPFLLEALDYELEEEVPEASEMGRRHRNISAGRFTPVWFERKGLDATLDALGPDNLMFESDFPHPTCLYPEPVGYISGALAKLTPEVRRKVMSTNAARSIRCRSEGSGARRIAGARNHPPVRDPVRGSEIITRGA